MKWTTKPKIAAVSGLVGLFVGVGLGGPSDDGSVDEAKSQSRALLQQARDDQKAQMEEATEQLKDVTDQADEKLDAAVDDAVADAIAAERAKQKRRIKAAVSKAVKKAKESAPKAQPLAAGGGTKTDPRFDTCAAANAAGYGNYRRGADPEYDWYQDRDNDGFVCE